MPEQKMRLLPGAAEDAEPAVPTRPAKKVRSRKRGSPQVVTPGATPAFKNNAGMIDHVMRLYEKREVYRHLVRELDMYLDHDIDEPRVMPPGEDCLARQVTMKSVIAVQHELEAKLAEVENEIDTLGRGVPVF